MKEQSHKTFGFVLKRFLPYKNKYTLFTLTRGKIDIVPNQSFMRDRLHVGMGIICYLERSNSSLFFASQVEIVEALLFLNNNSIQWVHQMAELCYYFLPREQSHVDIFIFLKRLFELIEVSSESKAWENNLIQFLCLSYLLKLFGFMPTDDLRGIISFFEEELFGSVDIQKEKAVEFLTKIINTRDLLRMNCIKSWVYGCLLTHPYVHHFKTFGSFGVPETVRTL